MTYNLNIHRETVQRVLDSEPGSHIGAFFDFDGTIISGYSVYPFVQEQLLDGLLFPEDLADLFKAGINLKLGVSSFRELMEQAAAKLRGTRERVFVAYGEAAYERKVSRMIYPEARALIQAHRQMGHTVAIVSSATPYQVEPALADLQVEHLKCTRYEVEDQHFTGRIDGEPCFGIGKVMAVDQLAEEHSLDIDRSFFYSDSDDDLLALEHVGRPHALNPNKSLHNIATRRGWPVRSFSSRGSTRIEDVVRNALALSSFVPTLLTGAAIWMLTGSRSEGQNFAISTFGDLGAALLGLRLRIRGEENLWRERPSVIIYNHQSNVDGLVLFKLLRRDAAAVGKKELSELPVVGSVFDLMGMIPIDRSNTKAAVETLAPLADFMHEENRSIVIAPEGTRSPSITPGRFKKGAFRIAMQAGVPIVPIVIHNSNDAQPRGDLLVRPTTLAVDVLEPIDVSDWTLENLEANINGVREKYLDVLGLTTETDCEPVDEIESSSVVPLDDRRRSRTG